MGPIMRKLRKEDANRAGLAEDRESCDCNDPDDRRLGDRSRSFYRFQQLEVV